MTATYLHSLKEKKKVLVVEYLKYILLVKEIHRL